jgi:uncharacterized protein DUF6883
MGGDPVTLPSAERAVVQAAKLRDYLLSPSHPVGRFKAAFFVGLGYSQESWQTLAADLRRHATENAADAGVPNAYGQKYEVNGILTGPTGRTAALVSVWIVLNEEDFPRFVTAFPGPRS